MRGARGRAFPAGIEPLEARIAPATLVNPMTVTYTDENGDAVTVTISKPLFTMANVNKVFTFGTGSVNGDNSADQQLELFNVLKLGHSAAGIDLTFAGVPMGGGTATTVDIGWIKASGMDLGTVAVGGDLGRINAGDFSFTHPAIASLTVDSFGAQGISTQAAGGNLVSNIAGAVGSITVNGDIDQAQIGIGGGSHGLLGSLTVTGSINGGTANYSGSVRTQGGITTVLVDGSINGGGGTQSGVIGTAGKLGTVTVDGGLFGGSGAFSGAILATGSMTTVTVDGDIRGGSGANSGEIGSQNNLGTIVVESSVQGSTGQLSGVILAGHNITSVQITNGLVGGAGISSGQIGAGGNIGSVTIGSNELPLLARAALPPDGTYEGIEGGTGAFSGSVVAGGNITSVTIGGALEDHFSDVGGIVKASPGIGFGTGTPTIDAGGTIENVYVSENVENVGIVAGANIGTVTIIGDMVDGSEIHARGSITTVDVNYLIPPVAPASHLIAPPEIISGPGFGDGIIESAILADNGSIGSIYAGASGEYYYEAMAGVSIAAGGNIGLIVGAATDGANYGIVDTEVVAGSLGDIMGSSYDGTAIAYSSFLATHNMGNVSGYSYSDGETELSDGILASIFQAGGTIASISASCYDTTNEGAGGIVSSGFNAGGSIGQIDSTGSITGSVFIAGINLGFSFSVTGAGTFDNASAASFGFGSSKSAAPADIGTITVTEGDGLAFISQSTFLAGVHGSGPDKQFGTKDDLVPKGSNIGNISSADGLTNVFVESGSIGATNSGPIDTTTYIATDSAVSAGGIGAITVIAGSVPGAPHAPGGEVGEGVDAIFASTFISNAGIGPINVSLYGFRGLGDNSGISQSTFLAGHGIGTITVTNNTFGPFGDAYGIGNSTFNAGIGGYGAIGDINVMLTSSENNGNTAGITNSDFDASVCACMAGSFGSISVTNNDDSTSAAGIVDSVFRVYGNIGAITSTMGNESVTAPAVQGSIFSAYGSIGAISVTGEVIGDEFGASMFLAGYDIGSGMTFGNQDLGAKSLALQGGQSIGNVTVTGYFYGSDIAASINPGAGYIFGDSVSGTSTSNDTNIGTGGTIGVVQIGTGVEYEGNPILSDGTASYAIEANTFVLAPEQSVPTASVFGQTGDIPFTFYGDGESSLVRVTNLTQETF
jgi:hypothetical protein